MLTVGTLGLGNKKHFLGSDVRTRAKLETMAPYGKKTRVTMGGDGIYWILDKVLGLGVYLGWTIEGVYFSPL